MKFDLYESDLIEVAFFEYDGYAVRQRMEKP